MLGHVEASAAEDGGRGAEARVATTKPRTDSKQSLLATTPNKPGKSKHTAGKCLQGSRTRQGELAAAKDS